MIKGKENTIFVKGPQSGRAMRVFCASLYKAIHELRFSDLVLDFSQCSWLTEATMLPLMPIIAKYQMNGIQFSLVLPKEESLRRLFIPFNGTSILCKISLEDQNLLEKALRFDDKPYDPAADYIELRFENEDGQYIFNMKEHAEKSFGSRRGGIQIRDRIEGLLKMCSPIILDFEGVGVISSSFADEVFGRLFVDMGPRSFMKNLEIRNADPTVEVLIDRAIMQRSRLGNGKG